MKDHGRLWAELVCPFHPPISQVNVGVGQELGLRRQDMQQVRIEGKYSVSILGKPIDSETRVGIGCRRIISWLDLAGRANLEVSPTEVSLPGIIPLKGDHNPLARPLQNREVTQFKQAGIEVVERPRQGEEPPLSRGEWKGLILQDGSP
jgi:hypothetical protein